jgi:hypothetical protein
MYIFIGEGSRSSGRIQQPVLATVGGSYACDGRREYLTTEDTEGTELTIHRERAVFLPRGILGPHMAVIFLKRFRWNSKASVLTWQTLRILRDLRRAATFYLRV